MLLADGLSDYDAPMELQQAYRSLKGALKKLGLEDSTASKGLPW